MKNYTQFSLIDKLKGTQQDDLAQGFYTCNQPISIVDAEPIHPKKISKGCSRDGVFGPGRRY